MSSTRHAGNGDGHGYQSGYRYSGLVSESELASLGHEVCPSEHGGLVPGDTIEVHYVHSSAQVKPGRTLGPASAILSRIRSCASRPRYSCW